MREPTMLSDCAKKWKNITIPAVIKQKLTGERLVRDKLDVSTYTSKRVVWDDKLESRFIHVISILGAAASPREILFHMNVTGLSGRQVGSHLQKFRSSRNSKNIDLNYNLDCSPSAIENVKCEPTDALPITTPVDISFDKYVELSSFPTNIDIYKSTSVMYMYFTVCDAIPTSIDATLWVPVV